MAAIERFEDIEAWKEARSLTNEMYRISGTGAFARDFALRDQLRAASISTMANIAEGFDSGSRREFMKFLGYALRSATEVQSHLYVGLDQGYLDQPEFDTLYAHAARVRNLTGGFIRYLANCRSRSH